MNEDDVKAEIYKWLNLSTKLAELEHEREQCQLFDYCTERLPPKELEALRTQEYSRIDMLVYEMIMDIKQITETKRKGTKQKYLNKLKKRMELFK